jgi:hypothetical protein
MLVNRPIVMVHTPMSGLVMTVQYQLCSLTSESDFFKDLLFLSPRHDRVYVSVLQRSLLSLVHISVQLAGIGMEFGLV